MKQLFFSSRGAWHYTTGSMAAWLSIGLLLLSGLPAAFAQTTAGRLDPTFNVASLGLANHSLTTVVLQSDGKVLVGGLFPRHVARLNADGSLDTGFNPVSDGFGFGTSVILLADGKLLLRGSFTHVNGVTRNGIARLNPDGTLDGGFNASTSASGILLQSDGKLCLFDGITQADGLAHLRRLNSNGTLDTAFSSTAGANGSVTALLQPDGKFVLTGSFTQVNGVARTRIARLNSDGSLDTAFNPSVSSTAAAPTLQSDGKIILTGGFTQVNGVSRSRIARLNADGTLDTTFNPTANSSVSGVVLQPDLRIIVYGSFTQINGLVRFGIARLNTDGTLDSTFDPGSNAISSVSGATVVLQSDGKLLLFPSSYGASIIRLNASGTLDTSFTSAGSNPATGSKGFYALQPDGKILTAFPNRLSRLNTNGSLDTTFVADAAFGPNGTVTNLAVQLDGKAILSGFFTQVNGMDRPSIVRLNTDGGLDAAFNPGIDSVTVVAVQADAKIVVGGNFTQVNGVDRYHIARLNADGTLDTSFVPPSSVGLLVSALAIQPDGKILVGGYGTLVRFKPDGSLDSSFSVTVYDPYTNQAGRVHCLVLQADGKILVGGLFGQINGMSSGSFARLNADGSLNGGSGLGSSANVYSMALQSDGKIILGGDFASVNGIDHFDVARLNANCTLDNSFNPILNGFVYGVSVQSDDRIVLGGNFSQVSGISRKQIVRLNGDGSVDTSFDPGAGALGGDGLYDGVFATVARPGGKILIGGAFTQVNGVVRNYTARLNANGSLDLGFAPGAGLAFVLGLALQTNDGKVVVGGDFTATGGRPANALARLRNDGSLDASFTAPFAAGDIVQALQRQSGDGAIVASAVVPDTSPRFAARWARRRSDGSADGPEASVGRPPIDPHVNSKIKNPIVRCSGLNGILDLDFNTNAGTNGIAYSLSLQPNGQIIVGGAFAQVNGTGGHANLGRLNADGSLDTVFAPFANDAVQVVLAQADGRIALGGYFTQVNGMARVGLARLRNDGSLDGTFNPAAGTNGPVTALRLQSDGKLVAGGSFSAANNTARSCLARLNADGTLDTGFAAGTISSTGATAAVLSIDQQVDGKLVIAGQFDHIGSFTRNKVARLNTDGSVDNSYDPGAGPDATVRAVVLQPDGRALLGGDFTSVDNSERAAAARLLGDYDLTQYPALSQWRIINFGSPNATGNAADTASPYGDGVPNLLKYALNLNPRAADAASMTANGTRGLPLARVDSGGTHLTLTFVRRLAATTPGITYQVQFSDGLTSAFTANSAATVAVTAIDSTWERVTVTDSVSLQAQPRRFARLQVSSP